MIHESHDSHPRRRATRMLDTIRVRSRSEGYECDLTREWILKHLERGTCAVTGIPFDYQRGHGAHLRNKHGPSIDRVDSTKGYTQDNCQVVISQYNAAKGPWRHEDILVLAHALLARESLQAGCDILDLQDAQAHLLQLIEQAKQGQEVILTEGSEPVAKIIPISAPAKRQFGSAKGLITMSEDFHEPLKDLREYM